MEQWLSGFITNLPDGTTYYLAILLIAFLESLPAIGLLVPGSTIIVLSGFMASHQHGILINLVIYSIAGAYLGDLVSFELGHRYGSKILKSRIFRRKRHWVKQSEVFFIDHGGKSLFFARFLGPIRGITPCIAGLSDMPRKKFQTYAPISSILWGISYPGLGFIGGNSWQEVESLTLKLSTAITMALIVAVLQYIIKKKLP